MRELVFHLAETIRSDQHGALAALKEQHEGEIRIAEDSIRRLCKKKYQKFLDAHEQMDQFKDGLSDVRTNLTTINDQITHVTDKQFFQKAQETENKREELT